jgi:hypothetical protein
LLRRVIYLDYSAVDIEWTYDGDFAIDKDGDLKDTSYDEIQALIQEIQSIVKSRFKDWKAHPSFAANLHEFRGEPNTREVGRQIQDRVFSTLVNHNVVQPGDLDVRVVPIHIHQIAILIRISALATPQNSLELGQPLIVALVYDSVEDSVFYEPENRLEEQYRFKHT